MFNPNFYNNFRGNNVTFQSQSFVPPPPPPPFYVPSLPPPNIQTDDEFVKQFETVTTERISKPKTVSISEMTEKLRHIVVLLNDIKSKENMLKENISLSDEDWKSTMNEIEQCKALINTSLVHIKDTHLDALRKLLAKRSAKRLRLKRVHLEQNREKMERVKELRERSRKIDENLQKIKDDIHRSKQEEEAKLQADVILKEVLRKKHDAKKCIVKLEALVKLRKARQNTAKGRGENVSEKEAATFNGNIEKLKSLWSQKLIAYEKEESELRAQLKQDTEDQKAVAGEREREVLDNLDSWRTFLFGGGVPQVDFGGDIAKFVAVRSQWDQYLDSDGSPLPVGWVLPT